MSKQVPLSVNGLAEIAAAAGQAGIAGEDLIKFTDAAAKVGTAFDISADMAGESMAKMMTGLGLTIDQTVSLTDAMNHLSNSQASNADQILDVVRRVGAQGKQFGFSAEQSAAFGSAMIAAGAQSEVAATSFMNMGRALTRGESATKRQSVAMAKLGLDATDVARRMQEDAVGTTVDVMERIAALPADIRASVSSDLFGNEARALGPLLTNLGLVRESLAMVSEQTNYAGSAFKEYETRSQTYEAKMRRFQNRMTALSISVGDALLPALSDAMDGFAPLADSMARFVDTNQRMVAKVMATVASLIAFRGAVSALRFAGLLGRGGALSLAHLAMVRIGGTAGSMMGAARSTMALQAALAGMSGAKVTSVSRMGAAMRGLAGSTPALRVATPLLAGAIATVATISAPVWLAIAAGVAAVGAAWKYWDRVSAILSGVGDVLRETFAPAIQRIQSDLEPLEPVLRRVGEAFQFVDEKIRAAAEFARSLGAGLFTREILTDAESERLRQRAAAVTQNIVTEIGKIASGVIAQADRLHQAGVELLQSFLNGLKSKVAGIIKWVRTIPQQIAEAIGRIDLSSLIFGETGGNVNVRVNAGAATNTEPLAGSGAQYSEGPVTGARAKGGRVSRGGTYLVGEEGPEKVTFGSSGYVHANGSSKAGVSIGALTIQPQLTFTGASVADADRIADRVMRRLREDTGSAMRSAFADIGLS